ncbi:MAG: tRNA preQ1(34) S-adenosylmethionine ribosyltransferase-isomerase QueA [Spirochaetales bacterium]
MKTKDFFFDLPEELIAQYPVERGTSRLLVVNRKEGRFWESRVQDLPLHLPSGAVIVFNNSKVRKARLFGLDPISQIKREFLFLSSQDGKTWEVLTPKAKRLKPGKTFRFPENRRAVVISGYPSSTCFLSFDQILEESYFQQYGLVPLPPYIHRTPEDLDDYAYQTVYAQSTGSVAAPTAGLHFTEELLTELERREIERLFVTLHVGLGTFEPIRTENIENHQMHREYYEVSKEVAEKIQKAKQEGRKVIAVGTTSVRVLEAAALSGSLQSGAGYTDLYITPGFTFRVVDILFTNFHTPGSTLLVLVSAFAGLELMKEAYTYAIQKKFRFFSYGDAMLIL